MEFSKSGINVSLEGENRGSWTKQSISLNETKSGDPIEVILYFIYDLINHVMNSLSGFESRAQFADENSSEICFGHWKHSQRKVARSC